MAENMLTYIIETLALFWQRHPALFYGLSMLLGFYGALEASPLILIPLFALWLPYLVMMGRRDFTGLSSFILSALVLIASIGYGTLPFRFPSPPPEGIAGTAYITINSLSSGGHFFGNQWRYRCRLDSFYPKDSATSIARHVNCSIVLPDNDSLSRPLADRDYRLEGTLMPAENNVYRLKIKKEHPWHPLDDSWSSAEMRYQAKQHAKAYITAHIHNSRSAAFIAGLATGEFDDAILAQQLGRFGLQHLMAISGFHFAIIAAALSLFLRLIPSRRARALGVVCLLSAYFLFLGTASSIMRAWVMISIAMFSQCFERTSNALNSLGVALMAVLLIDPFLCQSIGFQFSFLTTAAILLYFSPVDEAMTKLLPKRPLSEMIEMDAWNQHAYYILALFRQGVALMIAVNIFAFPMTLYIFHKFPWMGLAYNLFFPMLVSVSMVLLLTGLVLPGIGNAIHTLNSAYTQWILDLTYNMPVAIDFYSRVEAIPSWMIVAYVTLLMFLGIFLRRRLEEKTETKQDFVFI